MLQTAPTVQRFFSVLGEALEIGLETTVPRSELAALEEMKKRGELRDYTIRDPNARGDKPEAKTASLTHPAEIEGSNLLDETLSEPDVNKSRTILFGKVPSDVAVLFQRLNFKQTVADGIKGMVCGRFDEANPFPIRQPNGKPYINLDFFSKTQVWKPLFVKYHLTTTKPECEFGYLRIDGCLRIDTDQLNHPMALVSRVREADVPEFLRAAETLPA